MRRFLLSMFLLIALAVSAVPVLADDGDDDDDDGEGGEELPSADPGDLEITFPVSGLDAPEDSFIDDYEQPRGGGRVHMATDIMAPFFQPIHAAAAGEVTFAPGAPDCWGDEGVMPSYGWMIRIMGDDGRQYSYVHLNDRLPSDPSQPGGVEWAYAPDIACGERVERGQWIGFNGDSGNAKGIASHLHLEICDPEQGSCDSRDGRINPFELLVDALERDDVPDVPEDWLNAIESEGVDPEELPEVPEVSEDGGAEPGPVVDRVEGVHRVETAAALAQRRGSADHVIVAPAGTPSEALSAAGLSGVMDAPVLLTFDFELDPAAAEAIESLGASSALVLGGPESFAPEVEDGLTDAGVTEIDRIDVDDAASLSAEMARRTVAEGGSADTVLLVRGGMGSDARGLADAISASALAAHLGSPVLLTTGTDLDEALLGVLGELEVGELVVIGGTEAVSEELVDAAVEAAGLDEATRVRGQTRYETSVAVAELLVDEDPERMRAWVATGLDFPDALAAGPAVAAEDGVLVLVDGQRTDASGESHEHLSSSDLEGPPVVVGGTAAISDAVATKVAAGLR